MKTAFALVALATYTIATPTEDDKNLNAVTQTEVSPLSKLDEFEYFAYKLRPNFGMGSREKQG